jgi:exopolysaccharide biosynthesis polyprenyl glycosylphosphotransferase
LHISNGELVAEATFAEVRTGPTVADRLLGRSGRADDTAAVPCKQGLRLKLYLSLVLLDCFCLASSFALASAVRLGDPFAAAGSNILAVLLPVFAAACFNMNAYGIEVLRKPRVGIFRSVISLVAAVAVVLLAAFFLKASADYSRMVLVIGTCASAGLLSATRFLFGKWAISRLGGNPLSEVVIVDGVHFPKLLQATTLNASQAGLAPNPSDPLMLHRLGTVLQGADRVVVACAAERRPLWALLLKGANIQGEVLSSECEEVGAIGIGRFADRTTMAVSCGPLDLRSRALKRALDLAITIPIIIFLAPLLLVVACAVRFESAGPVFFVQKRLGRGNRLFSMLKFRSMRADLCDPDGNQSTIRDDDRVTAVGKFIRATSIDELPQLLNVLRGDMSLVGPRPHALGSLAGAKLFWEVDQRYWHRHACKPGITGLAQVRGFRGATHESSDLANRLGADLEYLAGWSIWRDVAILLRTFRVLVHKNAY